MMPILFLPTEMKEWYAYLKRTNISHRTGVYETVDKCKFAAFDCQSSEEEMFMRAIPAQPFFLCFCQIISTTGHELTN